MPELPDIEVYLAALRPRVVGGTCERIRVVKPFLLRSVDPPLEAAAGKRVAEIRRLGKRIVFCLEGDVLLVLHLMIAGRLQWKERGAKPPGRRGLAAFDFSTGTLLLTEAGSKRRASLYVVRGEDGLTAHDPGGHEVLAGNLGSFLATLVRENHTLKRALTDPRIFSGIGNAYSDEILHRARLSPFRRTRNLQEHEIESLYQATREVLEDWTEQLLAEVGNDFPKKVTAFREGMAVHGRYGKPCPVCGAPIQRILYAESEANYCAGCQTGGRLLADRVLSKLLKKDWPQTLAELEEKRADRL
ncbi:MAG: formamidopyrimidine-DNA glycosylase [Acidobacteriota bacterium]|nr:formamidopyrimidine-DNA glycosylase [Acidobacteriota bacterium]